MKTHIRFLRLKWTSSSICRWTPILLSTLLFSTIAFGQSKAPSDAVPANFNAEAHVRVLPVVAADDPGPYAITTGTRPGNFNELVNLNFEPFNYRTKSNTTADSFDELILPRNVSSIYGTVSSGFFNGATARIYRITKGKLHHVRTDIIKEHVIEEWDKLVMKKGIINPKSTTITFKFPDSYRRGIDYWLSLIAIDESGNESEAISSYKVSIPEEQPKIKGSMPQPSLVKFKKRKHNQTIRSISSIEDVSGSYDTETDTIELHWKACSTEDISGYQILFTNSNPDQMRGNHLYLATKTQDPKLEIKAGDLVFIDHVFREFDLNIHTSPKSFSKKGNIPQGYFQPSSKSHWKLVDIPKPAPEELTIDNSTCVQLDLKGDETVSFKDGAYSNTTQDFFQVLSPEKTYVVELWARQEGMANPFVTFEMNNFYKGKDAITPTQLTIGEDWKKYTFTFKVSVLQEKGGVGNFQLSIKGPGTLWLDNWRVYDKDQPFLAMPKENIEALKESGMAAWRTHSFAKSKEGYTMQGLTNSAGGMGYRYKKTGVSPTLPDVLSHMTNVGMEPWLQIEGCMSEEEWKDFVEYFCAPYDPKVDTPTSKPFAAKRYRQGHKNPYLDDFHRVLFEVSNETWNSVMKPFIFAYPDMPNHGTDEMVKGGTIYGLFQEYVISQLKSSPYWSEEAEKKFEFVLGGWSGQVNEGGFTLLAAEASPSSKHITIASYNGGWDEKEPPAIASAKGYFDALSNSLRKTLPRCEDFKTALDKLGRNIKPGTYEAGPGYNLGGLNGAVMTKDQVEQESQTMKSLAAGTANLDSFLIQGLYGFKLQNFFTFNRRRDYWSSHAPVHLGGQAYPSWKLMTLYNNEGTGDFLISQIMESPTYAYSKVRGRDAIDFAPLIGVYATKKEDRLNVFVLSRKVKGFPFKDDLGYTPLTLDLPIVSAKSIKLFRMTGEPGAHNLDADLVKIESMELPITLARDTLKVDENSGADARGMPAASTYLYVLEGVKWKTTLAEEQLSLAPGQSSPFDSTSIRLRLSLSKRVETIPQLSEFIISGSAGVKAVKNIVPVESSFGTCYDLLVNCPNSGIVRVEYDGKIHELNVKKI